MIRMYQQKLGVSSLILLLCAGVNSASAAAIHWTPATHQILQADFNHDGTPDLLLQAKTSAGKHYLVAGRSAGDPRYDFSKSIALPDRLNNLIWSQDKFQLLALPTREGTGSAMLAIAQNGSNALLFSRIDDSTAWSKPHQIYEPKQHKWLRSADSARYFSGDFNGDGKVDLLQLDSHHGEHQIILAEKNNRFEVAKKLSKTVQWGLKNNERLIIRDFNRDGQDDVFALSRHGKQPHTLLYSNGKGGFDKDDGKFISVNQAHLVWTDNASGITAVTRKSDKQTVLFRAYNQSERNKASERCLGWVFDTEANVAKEYCPDLNKGNGLESLAAVDDIELNDCPIEMSVDNGMTSLTPCDNGIILPTTPTSAPHVSSGPHTPGAQLSVLLANTWDNRAFTYQVWALDSSGSYHHLGDTAAPHGYNGADSVTINLSINTPGTYGLMYRGCNYDGCSGFGPSRSISIQQPVISHPVLTTASMGGQISPENPRVIQGQTATFHLTASEGYNILPVTGNCGGNTAQNPYTTAPINAPCQVFAHFARKSYTVTSTAGVGGVISPTPSIPVQHGDRATFTVTPNDGYRILSVLGCNGILSGRTYTTGPITASCPVSATFERLSYSVNSMTDGGGTISPTPVTVVLHGDTATFTVTPGIGKEVAAIKGCDGSRNGNSYKTVPITRACDVQATFTAKTYTVTATAGANGSITPPNRLVPHGQTTTFTVTPNVGYSPTVSNNCGGGSMSGTTFTVGPVTGHCAVSASFNLQSYTVSTTAGANGSISAGKTVNHGQSTTFTVTPNPGYTASATGCDGTLSGTTYTTGAITGTCNVQATFTANTYTVTATAGANGSITPPSRSVPHGQTTTFTVTPNAGFTAAANGCGGSLSGTTYTTGVITGACTVSATFTANTYTVTATAGANGSITPPSRSVPHGQTTTFTVTPNVGYSPTVSNNCGGGSMSGTTFTVGPVIGHCAVSASFNLQSYTVSTTAGANGSISAGKTVNHGQSTTFTVTPNTGYTASVSGCGGSLSGTTYTTGVITGACTVSATFTGNSYTVTATAAPNGSITPPSRLVPHGQTTTFIVTPNTGFTAAANGCGGSLSGTTYTTGVITGACTVSATFTANTYTVTATAGANGSITPPSRSVLHGQTTTFTVTPNAGFTAAANGCGGSLSGTTYTTGVITGACTVQASFAVDNTAQTIYLHTDALGSVILETDASGQVKKRTEYKPFGESKDN